MRLNDVKGEIKNAYHRRQPLMLWGPPGAGKSQILKQAAEEEGVQVIDLRLSQMDPVDLRGIPALVDGLTVWATPGFLPREGRGILFLDELPDASPSMQGACSQLILDRRLGDYVLPEGWVVFAAGNRKEDRASAGRMPTQVQNRFEHIEVEIDHPVWNVWALGAGIATEVIAFLRFRPGLLHDFDPKRAEHAFASPRSWEFASSYLKSDHNRAVEHERLSGIVGHAVATELVGFLRIMRDLPDPEEVLKDPEGAEVPTDPATLYALCGALASRVSQRTTPALLTYASRLTGEYSVTMVQLARAERPEIVKSQAFVNWAVDHQGLFS